MFKKMMCKLFPHYAQIIRLNECLKAVQNEYEINLKFNVSTELPFNKKMLDKLVYIKTGKKN